MNQQEERKHKHYALYKPHGYISHFIYEKKRKKRKLGELFNFPIGTMAIGRLDEDSEGLLLLTTDGTLSERVRSSHYEKEYFVQVDGKITDEALNLLRNGVLIGVKGVKYLTKPCCVEFLPQLPHWIGEGRKIRDERHGPTSWIKIILTEGKFRQVRKMTASVGFATLRLVRIRIGNITLKEMKVGEVKEIIVL
jgi:23S rRNA pseudouridine2457 synthase